MAPIMVKETTPLKRSSTDAGLDGSEPFKLRTRALRHHRLHWKQPEVKPHLYPFQDEELIHLSLSRSIALALRAVGFKFAEPVALDSFTNEVEEFMAHFLTDVRQSMVSCRRTQTLPLDYLKALRSHQLSLRSLLPHLDPPVSPLDSQIPLMLESTTADEKTSTPSLGSLSNGIPDRTTAPYIPQHFPSFPSKHTYKATPEFTSREADPKRIRERATEEGRFGEEALRRLVGAGAGMKDSVTRVTSPVISGRLRKRREVLWKETMDSMVIGSSVDQGTQITTNPDRMDLDRPPLNTNFENGLGGAVFNADRVYWRKVSSKPKISSEELLKANPNVSQVASG